MIMESVTLEKRLESEEIKKGNKNNTQVHVPAGDV